MLNSDFWKYSREHVDISGIEEIIDVYKNNLDKLLSHTISQREALELIDNNAKYMNDYSKQMNF